MIGNLLYNLRLASNAQQSPCLWLPSSGIKDVNHYNRSQSLLTLHLNHWCFVKGFAPVCDFIDFWHHYLVGGSEQCTTEWVKGHPSLSVFLSISKNDASSKASYDSSVTLKSKTSLDENFWVTMESFYFLCIYSDFENRCPKSI